MPLLANAKHETFAQAIATKGISAAQAYIAAGYRAHDGNACRLKASPKVRNRVEELKSELQQMRSLSMQNEVATEAWVIEQLVGIVMDARSQLPRPDSAGANKALNLIGLHLGMFVERKEVGLPGEFDGLTIEGKRDRVLSIATQLGLDRIKKDALALVHLDTAPSP